MKNETVQFLKDYVAAPLADVVETGEKAATKKEGKAADPVNVQGATKGLSGPTDSAPTAAAPLSGGPTVDTHSLPEGDGPKDALTVGTKPEPASAPKSLWDSIPNVRVPSLPSLSQLPEPGGIGFLLFLILLILFSFQSVGTNGETRLQLLWATIRGSASLAGETSLSSGGPVETVTQNSAGTTFSNAGYPTLKMPSGQKAIIPMTPGMVGG